MKTSPAPRLWARGFVVCAAMTMGGVAPAHDLWVVSGKYELEPGETTRVFVNNGDQFPQSVTLLGEHRVSALAIHGPGGETPVTSFRVDGTSLSFEMALTAAGSHVLALATRPRRVRMKASDFDDYLEENGLDEVVGAREELAAPGSAVQERYTKWAKALVVVDADAADVESAPVWSEPVGHTIEIVPQQNPNALVDGESLDVVVLYDGEPLAGALLTGGKAGGPTGEIRTRTDGDGTARVTFLSSGRWYLRSIHMIAVEDDPQIEWESFWCTLTFEVSSDP